MVVHEFLQNAAERYPEKTAIIFDDRSISYRQLDARANQFANGLISLGIGRGERVAVWVANSIDTVAAVYGVLKAGCVFVVLNPDTKPPKVAGILRDCTASVLVTGERNAQTAAELTAQIPSLRYGIVIGGDQGLISLEPWLSQHSTGQPSRRVADDELACLIYTSGSTGRPKGVVSGHDNVVFAATSIVEYLQNEPDDVVVNVLPFSFDYGLYQILMTCLFGGTLVIENAFAFPEAILRSMERHRVTGLPTVPTLTAMLLQTNLSRFDLSSLRYLTSTAAAFPVSHIRALQERLPGVRIYSMYGMTECKRTLYLPPERLADKPDSVGIPIPGTEVWIEDQQGQRLGPGCTGELIVRGRHVMRGYWGDPDLTARVYRSAALPEERVLRSGDLFRADSDGFYYYVARSDDIIKCRGEKVAPREVEAVLCQMDGVSEAAVVGAPHPVLGQSIRAYVVRTDEELTEQALLRHCVTLLERFMVPQSLEFVPELPRTPNGKVDKTMLAARAATLSEVSPPA